jgi:hypothetical protein
MKKLCLAASLSLFTMAPFAAPGVFAQSVISGDITGTITDPTGAVVPNAQVHVTNVATGEQKTTVTSSAGSYRVPLLVPGQYRVEVTSAGFSTAASNVAVAAGNAAQADLKLQVGQNGTTVEVTAAEPLINTQNGDLTTTFSMEQLQDLPNPGNDLTFIAQTAPGSVLNTNGGYGNFSSFGVPALSNTFTLDGGYENDPFLNLSNSGASNLLLGANDVDTTTVVSPAFSAQFGGLGGAQVNEITRGGANHFHGNANYYWNGRILNANDYFDKQAGNPRSFDNANQYAAAIGGPIRRDKDFFFVDYEGLRVVIPVSGLVYAPSQLFENCALIGGAACTQLTTASATTSGNGPFTGPVPASEQAYYKTLFATYAANPHYATAKADPADPAAVFWQGQASNFAKEWLLTARVDHKIGDKDQMFIHYKMDKGVQPTYTDLLSPLFSAQSPQPSYEGQLNETHTFTPNLTNQFLLTGNYYRAIFTNTNSAVANAAAPHTIIFLDGDLGNTNLGGIDYDFPQGRNVTGYQVIDDLSYNKGRHTIRVGFNIRRNDVTDFPQVESTVPVDEVQEESFAAGLTDIFIQRFPTRAEQPIALYNLGSYVQDEWKVMPNFTLTAGMRFEHNSNPTCLTNCFAYLANDVYSTPTANTVPYNAAVTGGIIKSGQRQAFSDFQKVGYQPRVSFAWQPAGTSGKTVVRGGFGIFTDTFPASITDTLLKNAPGLVSFTLESATITGSGTNYLIAPGITGSASAAAAASNAAFQTGYASGASAATLIAQGIGFAAPSFTTTSKTIKYPTYEEYSLAIEQSLDSKSTIAVTFVGNHGYHEPVSNGNINANDSKSTASFFPGQPTSKTVKSFGTLTNVYSGASSNFNGVVVTANRRAKGLTVQLNYEYGHALDQISNGGLEAFGINSNSPTNPNPALLYKQYGNADYDVRNNITGSYVWTVPSYHHHDLLTGGFEFSGTIFHNTGFPYSVQQTSTAVGLANYGGNLYARQTSSAFDHHCGGENHIQLADGSGTPCSGFTTSFASATDFNQQGRNTLRGPNYTDTDFTAVKGFKLARFEGSQLKIGAQFFNLFNHPNFAAPGNSISSPGTLGLITSTVSTPTSILGSGLGGNASPRLIQLKGAITF